MGKINNNNSNKQVQTELFSLVEPSKKVEVGFTSTKVSSFGGLAAIMSQKQNVEFLYEFAKRIKDWRNPDFIEHTLEEMITQRVLQISSGYEDADDCDILRKDRMLKLATGRIPSDGDLCSQPTMSRLENHVGHKELYELGKLFVSDFMDSYEKPPRQIIIDLDDFNSDVYGTQQLCLFNNYYGEYCYMPLVAFEGYSGKLIAVMLRPGRTNKRTNVYGFVRRLIRTLRKRWKKTVIIVRGDGMFSSQELMEWINNGSKETRNVHFVLGMTAYKPVKDRMAVVYGHMEDQYHITHEPQKTYWRILYRAKSWNKSQWLAVKVEYNAMGGNIRCVVTDLFWKEPKRLYEHYYCKRGDCELYIKELKRGVDADRMSCNSFSANQFRLFLHAAAYVVLYRTREQVFSGTDLCNASFIRLRERIILSPVIVTEMKTKIKIEFSDKHCYRQALERVLNPLLRTA